MAKFTIADVVNFLGIRRLRGGTPNSFGIVCPYCGDARGKNTVRIEKSGEMVNVFHCWNCGRGGNMLDLYLDLCAGYVGADRYKEAYADLKELLTKDYRPNYATYKKSRIKEAKKASPDILDQTYRTMLSFIRLTQEDKNDLLRRTLTEKEIADGMFKSTPYDTTGICRRLLKAGCIMEGVPGFFKNKSGEWQLNVSRKSGGYFCPVMRNGLVIGMQIRLRNPRDGQKYIWLSSPDREMGTSSGSPASFYGNPNSEIVLITEGILKANVAYCLSEKHISIIGVPGINAISDVRKILTEHNHRIVKEAYDMDKYMGIICDNNYDRQKCQKCVRSQSEYRTEDGCCKKKIEKRIMLHKSMVNLYKVTTSCGCAYKSYYWDRDPVTGIWLGNYKGIDDFLSLKRKGVIVYGRDCYQGCPAGNTLQLR